MKQMLLYAAVILLLYSLLEPYLIRINQITVSGQRIPDEFNGKKIAFLSDLHCGPFLSPNRVKDIVNLTNSLKADVILLGGDYVYHNAENIEPCVSELKNLKAPLGVYAVLGNHDNWASSTLSKTSLEKSGITVLDNKAVWVGVDGGRIRVGGVGDMWTDTQNITKTLRTQQTTTT